MPNVLLEEFSPLCNIQAFVEEDENSVHFYLWDYPGQEHASIRSCWVRNYGAAPGEINAAAMEEGHAPMLPADFCAHPEGAERLDPQRLSLVWFEEGDAAALLYEGEILSVIPGWAGQSGEERFPGYARDCTEVSDLCLPLGTPDSNVLHERVKAALEFWQSWEDNPWPRLQEQFIQRIESCAAPVDTYYAIDGGNWPPKALVKTKARDGIVYVFTIGASIAPQPKVELYSETPEQLRRFELAFAIEEEWLSRNEMKLLQYISAQTNLPWSHMTFLAEGHTIPCEEISSIDSAFDYVLMTRPADAPQMDYPNLTNERVNVLWLVPITAAERRHAEEFSSEDLMKRAGSAKLWIFDGTPKFMPVSKD
ncbi:suppressor of fused domain protein [Paenibacillus lutrae]|uniref:Suppressor of fused domain protein n=1 Tax=Paenibacillus lutrae TaxID=2078573 RepID=A0A7X3FMX8_9BACL|nr:suppressor of fused domain protein [Paenibacillus lutrae]